MFDPGVVQDCANITESCRIPGPCRTMPTSQSHAESSHFNEFHMVGSELIFNQIFLN